MMYSLMLLYPEKSGILEWARKISSYVLTLIFLVSKMEPSQPSSHNTIVNVNTLIVLKTVKAVMMSNLEEPIENISALVFQVGLGQ